MNYQETIQWMFNKLPMYQLQGASAYKKDLTNTILLLNHLNNPEKKLKCIHVAGTNGKGSTSHLLASVLQEAGYKVGLYTSPHLKDYRERIKINGKMISEEFVCSFINENKNFLEKNDLSFFEMTVGLAFSYFDENKTDINIIEVGMGGRLDSTNVITPEISVITNIGLDHTQFLGNTLEKIAFEKAGIIKENIPIVIGEYTPETKNVFIEIAENQNSKIYFAGDDNNLKLIKSELNGNYQIKNERTVLKTLQVLNENKTINLTNKTIENGFKKVIQNTGLQGRWQKIHENPTVVCDTAHNKHGLEEVIKQITSQKFSNLHIVLGVVNDKNLDEILPLFPEKCNYYFCKPNIPRGLDANLLKETAKKFNLIGDVYLSVSEAYDNAIKNASKNDFIFVGGSTFVVAEVL
ncbi:folylpolyglutamate synthase/dihydrofolate synthase family protein [Flavobacterium sp.]|uniref:bifunctional folylpolyglutamate synthase/dihydrofolate synthase n=1 Tax=Flavobacterium sp. TaxID=239 RepID=UPI0035AE137F